VVADGHQRPQHRLPLRRWSQEGAQPRDQDRVTWLAIAFIPLVGASIWYDQLSSTARWQDINWGYHDMNYVGAMLLAVRGGLILLFVAIGYLMSPSPRLEQLPPPAVRASAPKDEVLS
jgi:hypothetical protein